MRQEITAEVAYVGDSRLRYDYALWGLAIGVAVADIALTLVGLSLCFSEANPVARAAIEVAGSAGLFGLKGAAIGALLAVYRLVGPLHRRIALTAFSLPQLFAVGYNTLLLAQYAPECL